MAMMQDPATKPIAIGIPWYTRATYPDILEIMEDAATFPPNFDDWRDRAEATEKRVESEGSAAVRALIDPDEFPAWCRAHGLRLDGAARGRFASETAFRAVKRAN
jgi:hypothetical protein